MDVKTNFLNGVVEDEVYVEKPLNFETHDDPKTRSLLLYDVNMNCIKNMNEAHKSIRRETKQHRQYAHKDNKLITEFV